MPAKVIANHDLARQVDTTDEWIVARTGIRERRVAAPDEYASDLALRAAESALEQAGLPAVNLALIIVATISPDQPLPSCAVHLQRKLGACCPAFDLAAACAGFLYGLDLAGRYVTTGIGPVLVVGVEVLSRVLDWTDRETCVLFGDGAGAAIVDRLVEPSPAATASEPRGLLAAVLGADGRGAHLLQIPRDEGVVRMRGREVFRSAVTQLGEACQQVLDLAELRPANVDHAVMHQANRRILEALSRRIGVPWERFHLTIDRWGNTSSASIPLGLDDALRSGRILPGQVVLMAALGAGLAWGAAVARF